MYKIVSLKVNTVCTLLNEMQFNCFGILKLCCKVKNSVGGGDVAEWFRVLDLKSGGPIVQLLYPAATRICSQ